MSAWFGVQSIAKQVAEAPRPQAEGRPLDRRALEQALILAGQRGNEADHAVRRGEFEDLVASTSGTQRFDVEIQDIRGILDAPAALFRNAGLSAPEIVDTLPTSITDNFTGRLVFLTTDSKLYRFTSQGAWSRAVEAVDVSGQMTNAQIADLAATKISGQLTNAQLADIAATKVTGQLTNAQLADLAAAKLTGQIAGTQISDNAITTPKISAGAITAGTIAAGAIVADKIGANAITAVKISAGAVTAGKVAANAITANEIATNAITAAKISAGAVTAGKVAANAITANEIAANAITAAKIDAGAITATKMAANSITANNIVANTITGGLLATSGIITQSAQIGAAIVGEVQIADNAVTADKILVNSLSAISATIGTFQSAATGARTVISDAKIEVYDASGVLRVVIGDLT